VSDPLRYLIVIEHVEGSGYGGWVPDPSRLHRSLGHPR
jgi:hypothetical protein